MDITRTPPSKVRDCSSCDLRLENIFCNVGGEALEILNRNKVVNHYRRGQYVFYAGNQPAGLYCVTSGVVKLETEGASGHGHILRVVQAGGVLGYRAFFAGGTYEASAVVHDDATICLIPKSSVMELVQKVPDVAFRLLSQVAKELKIAEARLCAQTDKNAAERIAEAVLFLKDHFSEQVWTRKEIAEWAGTTPETVMRCLAEFEDEGFIEQKGRRINVVNRSALIERANLA